MKPAWITWMDALMLVLTVGALAANESEESERSSADRARQSPVSLRLAQAR